MDLEGILLSKINQPKKKKYCLISLICRILKIISQKPRADWWSPKIGWGIGNGRQWVKGYKLPVTREISSEDPVYSMVIIVNNTVLYT